MSNLRDLKRLKRIKTTCTVCQTARYYMRPDVPALWRAIDRQGEMPATWDIVCKGECEGLTVHFLDWPDKKKSKA